MQYETQQASYIQTKINELNDAHVNHQSRAAWKLVNEISDRKKSKRSILKGKTQEERLTQWKDHFTNLLGQAPVITEAPTEQIFMEELQIQQGDFTLQELNTVIKKQPNNKACGLDEIPGEAWKTGIMNHELLHVCNKVYHQEPVEIWKKSCILPFPKKGDLSMASNYRGISLIPVAAKLYNKMLLNRIRPVIDTLLRKNQNGFRQNRSTTNPHSTPHN